MKVYCRELLKLVGNNNKHVFVTNSIDMQLLNNIIINILNSNKSLKNARI